jgi:hypothetical protein
MFLTSLESFRADDARTSLEMALEQIHAATHDQGESAHDGQLARGQISEMAKQLAASTASADVMRLSCGGSGFALISLRSNSV